MRAGVLFLVLVLTSCAGYSVKEGGKGDGYDVYRPDPYLLRVPITGTGGDITGFKFEVKWLPNYNKRYRVTSWTGFGASDIKFDFVDGWKFTGIHDKTDNTSILSTLTDLTKHIIPVNPLEIAQAGAGGKERNYSWDLIEESNQPVLYKIEFDDCGDICGLKRFNIQDCAGPAPAKLRRIHRSQAINGGQRDGAGDGMGNAKEGGAGKGAYPPRGSK